MQAGGNVPHVQVQNEGGSRPGMSPESSRPDDQDSSQENFQRDWEEEQEWLQECVEPHHEVGPWVDLVG